jgi:ABC-type uncharacterized transport system permease subunit
VSGPSIPSSSALARGGVGLLVLAVSLSVLLVLAGADPLRALSALVYGAFGELALVGLGILPALRAGIFTIGSQGQLIAGAALSTAFVQASGLQSAPALLAVGLVGGVFGGMAYALLPAVLRAYLQVNEILSTLLLNYIAGFGLLWLLKGPLAAAVQTATPRSDALPDAALLPTLLDGTRLHWGLVFVPLLMAALAVWIRHRSGLVYRIFASHPALAARLGLSPPRAVVTTMLFAGATAGLAGWVQVAGVAHTLYPSVDGGLGFAGILVAVLGGLRPLGIVVAALFFAALTTGAQGMQMGTSVPAAIAVVAEGLVLLLLAVSAHARKGKG